MPRRTYIPDPPRQRRRQSSGFVPFNGTPQSRPAVVESLPVRRPEPPAVPEQVDPPSVCSPAPKQPQQPQQPQSRKEVPRWILQVRKLDLLEVAAVLGLPVEDDHIRPCPRCDEEAGAEVYRNKSGWLLWRCGACEIKDRGNLDLVSYAIAGEKAGDLEPERKALLRQWFADQGWCEVEDGDPV